MAGEITYQMLTHSDFIVGLVSETPTTLNFFQRLLGLEPGNPNVQQALGRSIGWDVFNNSRTLAHPRYPKVGPDRRSEQRVGHRTAMIPRFYESLAILDEDIFKGRPLGGNYGTVDVQGQQYLRNQITFLRQRMSNAREFMAAEMCKGGFSIEQTETQVLKLNTFGNGSFDVDYQVPAENKTDLDLGTGSGLLSGAWQTASTTIAQELNNINAAFVRIHGRPLRHIVLNTNEYNNMIGNTELREVAGESVRPFEGFNLNPARTNDNLQVASGGFSVQFRAVPQFLFHVYDGVLNYTTENDSDTSTTVMSKLMPDNKALFLPEMDAQWVAGGEGSEPIRENVTSPSRTAFGFNSWSTPQTEPPGIELHMLDNFLPLLLNPNVPAYGTVSA